MATERSKFLLTPSLWIQELISFRKMAPDNPVYAEYRIFTFLGAHPAIQRLCYPVIFPGSIGALIPSRKNVQKVR
jgi:hypothetical protein